MSLLDADRPDCEHIDDPANVYVCVFSTADPEPAAEQRVTISCLVCGETRRTEFSYGHRV